MKLNKKGFTLVELLAMLVVLGILMAVTVPNISGILSQSKSNIIKEDVNKMVDTTKVKISSNKKINNPENGKCLIFTLDYLNDSDDYREGPNGGKYDFFGSFVIVKREGSKYKYYVRLVEKNTGSPNYGINLADYAVIEKDWESQIGEITNTVDLKTPTTFAQVAAQPVVKTKCPNAESIQGFYKET